MSWRHTSMSWQQHQAATNTSMSWRPTSMSWQQHQAASPACLGTNTRMSWRQHHHVPAGGCLEPWRQNQDVLATAPGGLQQQQHVLARVTQTPACLGVNTSMSWQQHQAASSACLGTNSWHEDQRVLTSMPECLGNSKRPPQHVLARTQAGLRVNTSMSWQQHQAASPACFGTNMNMSCQHQHGLATARGGLPSKSWLNSPACLGTNTSMSWQQHQLSWQQQAASLTCLSTNTSMSWRQHQHV